MASAPIKDILTNKTPAADSIPLRDIHLPAAADAWPLAPGWWILMVLFLVGGVWLIRVLRRQARLKKRLAQIMPQLTLIENKLKQAPNNDAVAELNTLLRQIAVNYYPRVDIASLTSDAWLDFLDASGETEAFSQGIGRILATAPYQVNQALQIDHHALMETIKSWIHHAIRAGDL